MKTIGFVNTKGGCGKTTLCSNLGVWLATQGRIVMIYDADPQHSLTDWFARRPRKDRLLENGLLLQANDAEPLATALEKADAAGADFVLLDSPPELMQVIQRVIAASDVVVIPIKPSGLDVSATHESIRRVQAARKPFLSVLNEVYPRERAQVLLRQTLVGAGVPIAAHDVERRAAIRDGTSVGKAGFEMRDTKAGDLMAQLWADIEVLLAKTPEAVR